MKINFVYYRSQTYVPLVFLSLIRTRTVYFNK